MLMQSKTVALKKETERDMSILVLERERQRDRERDMSMLVFRERQAERGESQQKAKQRETVRFCFPPFFLGGGVGFVSSVEFNLGTTGSPLTFPGLGAGPFDAGSRPGCRSVE